MNQSSDNEKKTPLVQQDTNKPDGEQPSANGFKPRPILFAFTIIATLFSFFCYWVLDLRLPAIILVIFVAAVNYIATKREYEDELQKAKDTNPELDDNEQDK